MTPQDLLKFGLIPEFIGRLPVVAKLDKLDRKTLIKILTEPKNALVKQYKSLLSMDGVDLSFEKDAVEAIADKISRYFVPTILLLSLLIRIIQRFARLKKWQTDYIY